ncbi:MAG: hypothetical protein HYV59_09750 [Planctomycetes bacterium]|nr:hypothetical protein [Planctomycetota bacterium]
MGVRAGKQVIIVIVICFFAAFLFTYILKIFPGIMKDVIVATENIETDIKKTAKGMIEEGINTKVDVSQELTNDSY